MVAIPAAVQMNPLVFPVAASIAASMMACASASLSSCHQLAETLSFSAQSASFSESGSYFQSYPEPSLW